MPSQSVIAATSLPFGVHDNPAPQPAVVEADVAFWRPRYCPGLELRRARYRRHTFARHWHSSWSLGVVLEGETRFELSGQGWQAVAGDLVLIPPGVVHDCNPCGSAALGYWMFYLAPALWPLPEPTPAWQPVWPASPHFMALHQLANHLGGEQEDAGSGTVLRSLLETLLAQWPRLTVDGLCRQNGTRCESWLAQVAHQLACELTRSVPLAELSASSGISASHLNRRFAACYGLPPHRYQLQCRLDAAKCLLRAGQGISQVAHTLGFSDQSHFTRWFRRCVGATPARYQAGH